MIHPATKVKYIDDTIGYGVFATEFIPMGTITWVRDALDREITPADFYDLPEAIIETALRYSYRNNKGNYLLPWDHTRYTNHSFTPNTMLTPYSFEIAIRDIQAGDQITNDYGTLNIIESFEPNHEGSGRTMVHPDDLSRLWPEFDQAIQQALLQSSKCEQPLWALISADLQQKINTFASGKEKPISMLNCLYKAPQ